MSVVALVRDTARTVLPNSALQALRPAQARLSGWLNRGTSVQCPVCDGTFSRFLSYHGRPGALCPGCRTLERHRKLVLFLRRGSDLFEPRQRRVLHIAPERFLQNLLRQQAHLEYLSGDLQDPTAMVRLDVTAMQFADDHFDIIFCSHVLEHVPDDSAALAELKRVLAPGGWAVFDVPVDESRDDTYEDWLITDRAGRKKAFGQSDHVRQYGSNFPHLLDAAGFRVTVDPIDFTDEEVQLFGLRSEDHIFLVAKA